MAPENDIEQPGTVDWSERAKKILVANVINIGKKTVAGHTLSSAEVKILQEVEAHGVKADAPGGKEPTFAKNQTHLANILEVSRKTIVRYLKTPGNPGSESNGSYKVSAWRAFLTEHDVLDDSTLDQTALKAKQILLQNQRLENKIAIERKEWIPRNIAKQVFSQLVMEAKSRSLSSIIRLVTLSRVAANTTDAADAVRKEIEALWKSLEDSSWFTPSKK